MNKRTKQYNQKEKMYRAIKVMLSTQHIRDYLKESDPMALEQARKAIEGVKDTNPAEERPRMFNAMFDVAFTVISAYEDPYKIPAEFLLAGLRKRLRYLEENPAECAEAFGFSDQFEVDEGGMEVTFENVYQKEAERVGGGDTGLFCGVIPDNKGVTT